MTGSIHDIDLNPIIEDRRILRKNRNPTLALDITRVHHALVHLLVRAKHVALLQHRIDQRRLTMINVSNNRDIAQFFIDRHISYSSP